jgi:hypothetical protein
MGRIVTGQFRLLPSSSRSSALSVLVLGRFFLHLILLLGLTGVAASQVDPAAGILPFSTQQFGIDLATGAVHVCSCPQ